MGLYDKMRKFFQRNKRKKVFCIGYNKTGTTSIERVLRNLGYSCPNQQFQEAMTVEPLFYGDIAPLKKLCIKYDAFQDMPFSQGVTYAQVDCMFPGSKFILTVRDSNIWFNSLTRFHLCGILKKAGVNNLSDVDEDTFRDKSLYLHKNYMFNVVKHHVCKVVDNKIQYDWSLLYDKTHRINIYESRNKEIIKYFQNRTDQLLVIDIGEERDTSKIVEFLNLPRSFITNMPHLNRSAK